MEIDQLHQKVRQAQNRLEDFINCDRASTQDAVVEELITELATCLEELHVATEELYEQNQELATLNEEVQHERSRYYELFEYAPVAYIVTDAYGHIRELNQEALQLINISKQRFAIGKPLSAYIAPNDLAAFRMQYNLLLNQLRRQKQVQIQDWEIQLQPRDKPSIPVAICVSVVPASREQDAGFRWLIQDLTERKQAEYTQQQLQAAQELNELKTRFIRMASHEIRNPLNVVMLSASMLIRNGASFDAEKRLDLTRRIQRGGQRIAGLVENVLTLSKADANKIKFRPVPTDLGQFCQQIVQDQQDLIAPNHDIQLYDVLEPPCEVRLDHNLFQQALSNLISNAVKYSPDQSPIDIVLSCEADAAVIQVRDRGIGIPEEDQQHLFEPFHRAANVEHISGCGLGLSIIKSAVELHGGAISVESQLDQGTTFIIRLPLTPVEPSDSDPSQSVG